MVEIFNVQPIGEKVFSLLPDEDLLKCRLVCKIWKSVLEEPIFWLDKLKFIGHPNVAHDQWLDLIQKSMAIGKPKQELTLSLMLKYYCNPCPEDKRWTKAYLNFPPIYIAAKYGQLEVVKLIHHFDKDCNREITSKLFTNHSYIPLYLAIKNNQLEVVKYIVNNVENAMEISASIRYSLPLHCAIKENNLEMVKILAPKTKNINHQNKGGISPIHLGTKNYKIFQYLMSSYGHKINPNLASNRKRLPLHWVCMDTDNVPNRIEIVKILIPLTIDIDHLDDSYKSPVYYAQENGFTEVVELLLESSKANFINRVYNHPDTCDVFGRLPLHLICMENTFNFKLSLTERNELVKTLLSQTSNVNQKEFDGNTALHYAAYCGLLELVKILVEKCDVNIRNGLYLPIDLAIIRNDVEIVKVLAPLTKNFEPTVLSAEVHEHSWECFEIIQQINRKRKRYTYELPASKRQRHLSIQLDL